VQINEMLAQAGGLQSIARELGISEAQAASGAAALTPALLGGFKKQAQSAPGGIEGLGELLNRFGGAALLDEVLSAQPTNPSRGDAVLGQIFGSKDVSRTVAQQAAAKSGLDPSVLKKMLPLLAMLLAGYMAKQKGGAAGSPGAPSQGGGLGGALGDVIGDMMGGKRDGVGGSPSAPARKGGLAGMLDLDGDGNALDDIIRMATKGRK
jgi:hypothetical protein